MTDVLTVRERDRGRPSYRDREAAVARQASQLARGRRRGAADGAGDLEAPGRRRARSWTGGVGMVEVYRLQPERTEAARAVAVESPSLPPGHPRVADRLAREGRGSGNTQAHEPLDGGGELVPGRSRSSSMAPGAGRRGDRQRSPVGALAKQTRNVIEAYEDYSQLRVLRRPLEGVYLSLFLMMTLMILVSATWMGCTWRSGSRARWRCWRGCARDRRRTARSSHRAGDARRIRLAGRGVQLDGGGARRQSAHGSNARASTWSARTWSSRNAAATSRPSSNGSPLASSRSAPTVGSRR